MNWKEISVLKTASVKDALNVLDSYPQKFVLVVDETDHLLGTVVDGDIRRGLLDGVKMGASIELIMNTSPVSMVVDGDRQSVLNRMQELGARFLPIVTEDNLVIDLIYLEKPPEIKSHENWVVLMAGGEGVRLRPITENIPKPMVEVGGKPILETVIEQLSTQGFKNILISVNYKSDLIENYFEDGSNWGVKIEYIRENKKLGTAGCLSLIKEKPNKPFIVMNGDILSKVDINSMLEYHTMNEAAATMGVRDYTIEVPFGVVNISGGKIASLTEKPIMNYFINAGVYILEPSVFNYLEPNTRSDMTDLFDILIAAEENTLSFPLHEYWLDVGQHPDLKRARDDYNSKFNSGKNA